MLVILILFQMVCILYLGGSILMLSDKISQVKLTDLVLLLVNIVCSVEYSTRFTICSVVRGIVLSFILVRLGVRDFHCFAILVLVCYLVHLMVFVEEIILTTSLLPELSAGICGFPT